MDFLDQFPLRFLLNAGRLSERRAKMEERLLRIGLPTERFIAVDEKRHIGKWLPKQPVRGYRTPEDYAACLSMRLALREAKRRRAPAVLLVRDDAEIHPCFLRLIGTMDLPDDWGIICFGAVHLAKSEWAGSRIVRAVRPSAVSVLAVRSDHYGKVMRALDRHGKSVSPFPEDEDRYLTDLADDIPIYACYPNLAWREQPDDPEMPESPYHRDGGQKRDREAVDHLLLELTSADGSGFWRKSPKLALLFLTRGDVNHPEIWREFVSEAPDRVAIFSHAKDWPNGVPSRMKKGGAPAFLGGTGIQDHYETAWGDVSLVRATRALLTEALGDDSLTHFALLSESCVPVMPLPEILRRLEIDPGSRFHCTNYEEASEKNRARINAVPQVPERCWRFQSQWWLINRAAAVFSAAADFTDMFSEMFAPDESYFATVLALQGYPIDSEGIPLPSTWTWWERDAPHPNSWSAIPQEMLRSVFQSGAMFARKFPVGADIGGYGLHRSPNLSDPMDTSGFLSSS